MGILYWRYSSTHLPYRPRERSAYKSTEESHIEIPDSVRFADGVSPTPSPASWPVAMVKSAPLRTPPLKQTKIHKMVLRGQVSHPQNGPERPGVGHYILMKTAWLSKRWYYIFASELQECAALFYFQATRCWTCRYTFNTPMIKDLRHQSHLTGG